MRTQGEGGCLHTKDGEKPACPQPDCGRPAPSTGRTRIAVARATQSVGLCVSSWPHRYTVNTMQMTHRAVFLNAAPWCFVTLPCVPPGLPPPLFQGTLGCISSLQINLHFLAFYRSGCLWNVLSFWVDGESGLSRWASWRFIHVAPVAPSFSSDR